MAHPKNAKSNLVEAMDIAGLVSIEDDIVEAAEFADRFVAIIYNADENEYLVGVAYKKSNGGADFKGAPEFEGSLEESRIAFMEACLKAVNILELAARHGYTAYNGPAGASEELATENTKALARVLENIGVKVAIVDVVGLTEVIVNNRIHVAFDRWGFSTRKSELDNAELVPTIAWLMNTAK